MYCRQCGEKLSNPKAVICVKCGTNKGKGIIIALTVDKK